MAQSDKPDEIDIRLLAYLSANPRAADTVRGIVSHWLGLQPGAANIARVERSLERLRARGVMSARPLGHTLLWSGRSADPD